MRVNHPLGARLLESRMDGAAHLRACRWSLQRLAGRSGAI